MSNNIISRAYNTFTDISFGLIKKESNTMRLGDELLYYRAIQNDPNKSIFFPRLVGGRLGNPNWLLIEKYGYPTLGDMMLSGEEKDWEKIFKELIPILSQFSTFGDLRAQNFSDYAREMYIVKTEIEYENLFRNRSDLEIMGSQTELEINGVICKNFEYIWTNEIKKYIEDNMLTYESCMIHGDFCFSNILYGGNGIFKFIDMRGSFGAQGIYGDPRYDIAKLYHSARGGYEWLNSNRFLCLGDKDSFQLITDTDTSFIGNIFETIFFPAYNKKEIMIITACIFVGSAARHYENPLRQRALYLTGVKLMNEAAVL